MNIFDLVDPEFNGAMSSDEIWYAGESNIQLTDVIDAKSDYDHTHSGYATSDHTHSGYVSSEDLDTLEDVLETKADVTHSHTEYALSNHSHEGYATVTAIDAIVDEVDGKADANHVHTEYAPLSHDHDEYALATHGHSEYASQSDLDLLEDVVDAKADSTHIHSEYAELSHTHSEYATIVALDTLGDEVDGKADASHSHSGYVTTESFAVLQDEVSAKANASHAHTEYSAIDHTHANYATTTSLSELSTTVSGKANASHTHDDRYYTETEVDTKLATKADSSHTHTGVYDANGSAASALTSANAYTDSKIDALVGTGASTTLDTIGEISSAIEDNQDAIDLLNAAIGTKANASALTTHTSDVSNPHNVTLSQLGVTATASELNYVDGVTSNIQTQLNAKAASSHTHSYAGSSSVGGAATSANKLTTNAGSATQPVYFVNGVPVATTYTLGKSVPSDAVFTDTTYNAATTSAAGLMSASDKSKLDGISSGANAYTLPAAGSALGGVKTGGDVTISSGVITVNDDSHNHIIANIDSLQTTLDAKQATITGGASTIASSNLTTSRALISNSSGKVAVSAVTSTELGYLDGVTSSIQTQLDGKAASSHTHSEATTSAAGLMSASDKTKLNGIATGANKTTVDSALSSTSTNPVQNMVINSALAGKADADHTHNVFSSLEEVGITTFPTTMQTVATAMPLNSMIVVDTRRINGVNASQSTQTISDWGNSENGVAIITKGSSAHRIGLMIMFGVTDTSSTNLYYGNYAYTNNVVNWSSMDDKVDKVRNYSGVDLNTLTEPGLYYISSGTTALHCPAGSNGHMIVISDGSRIRQLFFRMGTIDTNSFQWYSRNRSSVTTDGVDGDGWSRWWLLSGCELAWSGSATLNSEINLGSRYGCQAWVIAGQVTTTGTYSTVYIPRYFLTTNTTKYKLQIADETGYVSFYFYYKESDNNVYAKVVWVSDTTNSALKYVYRIS